jgi:hypothetical protein
MTDSFKSTSQDDPYPDEDLLEGLKKIAPACFEPDLVNADKDGSLLLDSINAYTHSSQIAIEPIEETAEEELDPCHALQNAQTAMDSLLAGTMMGNSDGLLDSNGPAFFSTESPVPVQQASNE